MNSPADKDNPGLDIYLQGKGPRPYNGLRYDFMPKFSCHKFAIIVKNSRYKWVKQVNHRRKLFGVNDRFYSNYAYLLLPLTT